MNLNIITIGTYQIFLNKRIGLGWHSSTYQCIDSEQLQMQVVAKIYKNQKIQTLDIEKIKDARHANLVQIYEIFQYQEDVIIIMEKCISSLKREMQLKRKYEQTELQHYLKQILMALGVLQQQGLELKELKPTNILIDDNDQIKITNYGLSSLYYQVDNEIKPYAAPEIFFGKQQTPSKDIYTLGLILYHLLFQQLPFTLRCNGDVLMFIQRLKKQPLEIPQNDCEGISKLIDQMVLYESSDRITKEKLCQLLEINQFKRTSRRIMSIQPIAAQADDFLMQ